jgi:hypothetical protein
MSPRTRLLAAVAAAALLVPAAAVATKGKTKVKAKVPLAADAPLVVDVDVELSKTCEQWPCLLDIVLLKAETITVAGDEGDVAVHAFAGPDKTGVAMRYVIRHDGSWELRHQPEAAEEEGDEGGEEKDDQGKGKDADPQIEPDAAPPPDTERLGLAVNAAEDSGGEAAGDEAADEAGDDDDSANWEEKPIKTRDEWATEWWEKQAGEKTVVIKTGTLAGEGASRTLTIDAALLPTNTFQVATNGYYGAQIGEDLVGSGGKTGVIQIER